MANSTLAEKLTLKELIETAGFKKVFAKMAGYTQKEKKEAYIECWHDRLQAQSKDRLTYSIAFGNEGSVNSVPEKAFSSSGNQKKHLPETISHYTVLRMHTHPNFSYENPLQVIRFSDADINNHVSMFENATNGIVVFPNKTRARCLLWQPSQKLEGFGETMYEELERLMKEREPDRAAVSYLKNFGKSETIDFKLKSGVWIPESKHFDRIKQFAVRED